MLSKLIPKPNYTKLTNTTNYNNLFNTYTLVIPSYNLLIEIKKYTPTNYLNYLETLPTYLSEPILNEPILDESIYNEPINYYNLEYTKDLPEFNESDLLRIDIEDLLKSEGITSVNGKKIKFGDKNLRPQNASFGAENSNHKKRDPYTGNASARDISIVGGTDADYTEFRRILLNNPKVVSWMSAKGWGIINELTSQVLSRTNGTGRHFHFGPDTWAKQIWNAWLQDPNISVTQFIKRK